MAVTHLKHLQAKDEDARGESIDYFDLLPDAITLLILNNVLDSTSLCRCLLVSKRFAYLIPHVDSITIRIPSPHQRSSKTNLVRRLIRRLISKPLRLLLKPLDHAVSSSADCCSLDVYRLMAAHTKTFSEVRSVHLELPCNGGEFGANNIPFIKWTAEFGTELRKCVILGAASVQKLCNINDEDRYHESEFSDDDLRCRIMWIISSLLAASARHWLAKRMVVACPMLREAKIEDARMQGRLTVEEEGVRELRDTIKSSGSDHVVSLRTCLPDLVIRLWYVEELVLPRSRCVLRGATLMAVTPAKGGGQGGGCVLNECLEGREGEKWDWAMIGDAAREMSRSKRRKTRRVEMNSF